MKNAKKRCSGSPVYPIDLILRENVIPTLLEAVDFPCSVSSLRRYSTLQDPSHIKLTLMRL